MAPVWAHPSSTADVGVSIPALGQPPSFAEIWLRVGEVPLDRILSEPAPGTATAEDAANSRQRLGVNCELVSGTLVAKPMGFYESRVAIVLAHLLQTYLDKHPIGLIAGEDGPYRMLPENVRKPDVSFLSFARLPDGVVPRDAVCPIAPDLAVEVLSKGNTTAEMTLKRNEYFATGVRMVWEIDPASRTARMYVAVDQFEPIDQDGVLRGGEVLPGFEVQLKTIFDRVDPRADGQR
jgi:Uma2 family endonuclease